MKKIFCIFLSFFTLASIAQSPGYMGKKFYFSYSNLYSAATLFRSLNETGPTHSIGINLVTGKRSELVVSANYYAAKVQNDILQYSGKSNNQYYNQGEYTFDGLYYTEKMNSFGGSLALKLFRRDRFAPVGPYAKWEVVFYSTQLNIKPYTISYYNYSSGTINDYEYSGIRKIVSAGGGFGFGKQKILNDVIVVDVGIRLAVVYTINIDDGNTYYEQNLLDNVFAKMFSHEFLNARLGIGYLAF